MSEVLTVFKDFSIDLKATLWVPRSCEQYFFRALQSRVKQSESAVTCENKQPGSIRTEAANGTH